MKVKNNLNESKILCFIPNNLKFLIQSKNIPYKGTVLKSAYLAHIINELLTKYTLTGEISFTIWSIILQEMYGKHYARYIEYLVDNDIIILTQNKQVGKTSRRYKINLKFIQDEKIRRYEFYDKFLYKKIQRRKIDVSFTSLTSSPINELVRMKIIEDLSYVNVDCDKAMNYLNNIKNDITLDSYLKNEISITNISNNDIYYKFDGYGRFHTNFTTLKKYIRNNYLKINNEDIFEIDIKNSQPFFLAILMKDYYKFKTIPEGIKTYIDLAYNGLFYEDFEEKCSVDIPTRELAKKYVYKVFFGKNVKNKINLLFKKYYPEVYEFILNYKNEYRDYKALSHKLQKLESDFIFNHVVYDIMILNPEINLITIHDSIIVSYRYKKIVEEIFDRNIRMLKY